ncbi:MAG: type II toxin-antitoxin system HigB family toxin [Bacteroidetes bacterium HGW-Bacteroidetes-5]|nr:MAG: type II toxin-antitoxin system HigB family toxin [Bacteroidetes bacterium HGW-Bacteroidetes-5]
MRIITFRRIMEFSLVYADADIALREWYKKTQKANWSCYADIKKSFNSADAVGNSRFVFNIKGNSYRLIAIVLFKMKTVYIRSICTHSDYDKIDAANI